MENNRCRSRELDHCERERKMTTGERKQPPQIKVNEIKEQQADNTDKVIIQDIRSEK
jgi:hypothetical protein